jgi:hypothetical protein
MRRALGSFVVSLLLATGLVAIGQGSAQAAGGSLSAGDILWTDSCWDHPYSYSVSVPPDAWDWDLEVDAYGPDGVQTASDYVFSGPTSGSGTVFLCSWSDRPGTYTLRGTLTVYTDRGVSDYPMAAATFQVLRPLSRARLTSSTYNPRYRQAFRMRVRVTDQRPAGYFRTPYATVVLQARRDGRWVNMGRRFRAITDENGVAVYRVQWLRRAPLKVRAKVAPDEYAGSVSNAVRLR